MEIGNIVVKEDSETINSKELLRKYYNDFGYSKKGTGSSYEDNKYRLMLMEMLRHADSLGLDRRNYHDEYINRYDSLASLAGFDNSQYESENELIFSDAALSFLYDVAYGREVEIAYNGVKYHIDSTRIIGIFDQLISDKNWRGALDSVEPKIPQYLLMKNEMNRMVTVLHNLTGIDTEVVNTTTKGEVAAIHKLKVYGCIPDSLNVDSLTHVETANSYKRFQRMMSLDTTGILDKKTTESLNFPLSVRVSQMKESLNYWRWTGRLLEREFILVNIPAARLRIVNRDSVKNISMKVILGKTTSPTPSFTAYISRVITYPYWVVPISIATKEMLPKIKINVEYFENNNLQVVNNKGDIIDPRQVDWKKYSKNYLPYTFRQSTGCDNSLGVLKFDLNSPFSIYLHDTNARGLFGKKERFMSHGCVRVERPMELANYLLDNSLDSTKIFNLLQCLKDQIPTEIPLKKHFPVLLLYMTADIDENGHLRFYKDIYLREKSST
ncbi:MAG: L,D-transpeptidase family protein [Bacteroidetes bacterium]|nr:L,D-transpeptidase family protein [Bacteroidota bacterium]